MSAPELDVRIREPAGEPSGALVMLHGRGADENDLFPLLDMLDPERRLVGACPGGPLALPPGGRHWYAVYRVGYPDPATFLPTFGTVAEWLDRFLDERGLDLDRTVLGGFSQGTVMSYSLALGPGRRLPAGLVAFSGFIPEVEGFDIDLSKVEGWPVTIGHGSYDPVIPVEFGRAARDALTAARAEVTYRESPMAHSIDPAHLDEVRAWLASRLD